LKWLKENNKLYGDVDVKNSAIAIDQYVDNNLIHEPSSSAEIAKEVEEIGREAGLDANEIQEIANELDIDDNFNSPEQDSIPHELDLSVNEEDVLDEIAEENKTINCHAEVAPRILRTRQTVVYEQNDSDDDNNEEVQDRDYFFDSEDEEEYDEDNSDNDALVVNMKPVTEEEAEKLRLENEEKLDSNQSQATASCNTGGHLLTIDNHFDQTCDLNEPIRLNQYGVTLMDKENLDEDDLETWKLNRNAGIMTYFFIYFL
jgi:hypothetical protein